MATPTSLGSASNVALTGTQSVDALLAGIRWTNSSISYSFPGVSASWSTDPITGYGSNTSGSEPWSVSYTPLSLTQQMYFAAALQQWSNVANLQFTEVRDNATSVGDMRIAFSYQSATANAQAWSVTPGASAQAGDVWFNSISTSATDSWAPGSFSYFTSLHEIGHALGFKHPFYEAGATGTLLPAALDTRQHTVMAYTHPANDLFRTITYNADGSISLLTSHVNPETPMVLDIAAMQYIYGANTTYRTGDDVYTFSTTTPFYKTIWDAGGNDTISVSNFTEASVIDLTPGNYSSIRIVSAAIPAGYTVTGGTAPTYVGTDNLGIANGTIIENAIGGSGNDTLIGNRSANNLDGGSGNDILTGGTGNDTLTGGLGTDTAIYSSTYANTTISLSAASSVYTLTSLLDGTDLVSGVELFQFSDQSVAVANLRLVSSITGGVGNDILVDLAGNNIIDGGAGRDSVIYASPRADFTVRLSGTDFIVTDTVGSHGIDTMTNVERLSFSDGTLGLDTNGNSGQMYRLYKAAFNRVPDALGLGHNIRLVDASLTLSQMSAAFVGSAEFTNSYGVSLSNTQFIDRLYLNVLGRVADPVGGAWNLNLLDTGAVDRPSMLAAYSESAENQLALIGQIQDGIWFT